MDYGKGLKGKKAIIFGASRGIGLNIASHLLGHGTHVTISSGNETNLDKAYDQLSAQPVETSDLSKIAADLSKYETLDKQLKPLNERGPFDVVVLSSAVLGPSGDFASTDFDDWVNTFQVNVFGSAKVVQYFLEHRLIERNGKIIVLSGGISGPDPYFVSFSSTKHALNGFAYSLAHQLCKQEIWINSVLPGSYHTRMNELRIERGPESIGADNHKLALSRVDDDDSEKYRKLNGLMDFLCSAEADGIYGRLISAQYDGWQDHIEQMKDPRNDLYKSIRTKD